MSLHPLIRAMGNLRFVPEGGALVEITCRTIQGRLLLRPTKTLQQIVAGVLHRAQTLNPQVEICNIVVLANHYHLLLRVPDAQTLARFMGFVNGNLSRKLGRLVGWSGPLWARRYDAVIVAEDEESQVARLIYLLSHGVKEGLVRSPQQWPGLHGATALQADGKLEGYWQDDTRICRDRAKKRQRPDEQYRTAICLQMAKLPCWKHLSWEEIARQITELVEQIIEEGRAKFSHVPGPKRVQRQNPLRRTPKPRRRPRPIVHAVSKWVRQKILGAYAAFVAAYRRASELYLAGDLNAPFPETSCRPPGPWASGHPPP